MQDELFVCEGDQQTVSETLAASIATIISHGRISANTLAVSQKVAALVRATASLAELRSVGLTERQAASVLAAVGIGRELCSYPLRRGQRFSNSRDLFNRYRARFFSARKEYFLSLQLNSKNELIREVLISVGSLSSSIVHPREVFAPAVRDSSAAAIFLHNHPSGDPAPSGEDRECTLRLVRAGKILGIRVLDHIVMGFDDYFSFADAGVLEAGE
jgi:DNA repair protein RadC